MSDTCIVCLGDLSTGIDGIAAQSTTLAKSPLPDDPDALSDGSGTIAPVDPPNVNNVKTELIAHILPCGHDLHNDCLTPWVERANSCPICRATFHQVELMDHVGGHVISSYTVQDRTQVAELDPSMFLEMPDEEDDDQPCQACGEFDNDDVLMYCDGCDKLWHTYCVGLQEVPRGAWYCEHCRAIRDTRPQGRRAGTVRRRTRGQQRRQRGQQHANESEWNDVWQTVFSRLGMDLDFPHDEDGAPAAAMRRHRQRVEGSRQAQRAWLSRVRVAELAGAGHRFRENEDAILNGNGMRRPRASPLPHVETPDETEAWNAFEEARAPSAEPSSSRKRKRKANSTPSSPTELKEESEPEPVMIKRRRPSKSKVVETTEPAPTSSHTERQTRASPPRPPLGDSSAPSFLQSLLQEVEDSSLSISHLPIHRPSPRNATSPPAEQNVPRPSSPALSLPTSNHSSPRAMSATPPPLGVGMRPTSPMGLSSSIQPVFPSSEYSPLRTTSPEPKEKPTESSPRTNGNRISMVNGLAHPRPHRRTPRILEPTSPESRQTRSLDTSPTRANMSLMAKSDVQKLVSAALKPHYNEQKISKDEYTTINRDISRMLYDKIGDFERLDVDGKAKWEKVAGEEVNKAVGALRAQA